jgi:hypothetical protein
MSDSFPRLHRLAGLKQSSPNCGRTLPEAGADAVSDETVIEPARTR